MSFQTDLPAAEAFELHCYLDNNAIPNKIYVDDGELEDNLGKYYLPSLVERVEMLIAKLTPTSSIKSEVAWNPLDLVKTASDNTDRAFQDLNNTINDAISNWIPGDGE